MSERIDRSTLTRDEARERAALIHDARYAVTLDLTREDGFTSDTTIRFACNDPGEGTYVDLSASTVTSVELNGSPVGTDAFDGHRIALAGLLADNELRIVAECTYHRTEVGMHRFTDPIDDSVYLHTDFEPFDAHRVFACFDQPDIKGTFDFTVIAPADWEVMANSLPVGEPAEGADGSRRWTFATTPPIPTYITCVCAGHWHAVRDELRGMPLGVFCRRSLAEHLEADEILEITKQGMDFFEAAYGVPYPFGKFDQVFVPESNTGAMENAGCVTFNDIYVFRSRVTRAFRAARAETILHEMAHMWFGDTVTMRWWNDLWLNESFATYMSVLAQVEATRFTEGWTTFASMEKTWAYKQDQLPTTHPIVADIPDLESIHLNFDGITYSKGASVLKQLAGWVGRDAFLEGIRRYTMRHAFGNAELNDFLKALEETSGRDLGAWSKEWLETAGVNTLRGEFQVDGGRFGSFALVQTAPEDWPTLRSHRVAIGLYDASEDGLSLRRQVEVDVSGERTQVPQLAGEAVPDLTLVNDGDLTFAKVRLDRRSLDTLLDRLGDLDDSLARTLCWTACWDMTRDGEMPARDYLTLVINNIRRETEVGVVQTLLAQCASAANLFGDPANRDAALSKLAAASLEGVIQADPGSDHQLAWARSFIAAARAPEHVGVVRGLLDGSTTFDGLAVDTDLRWHIVRTLASSGTIGSAEIDAEAERDPSDRGRRRAAGSLAALPSQETKEAAWNRIVEDRSEPLALTEELMAGFQQFGQEALLEPYVDRFFDALPGVWETRDLPEALEFGRAMYPAVIVSPHTVRRTEGHLASGDVPGPIRRLLVEGMDAIQRALRARHVDAAAAALPADERTAG